MKILIYGAGAIGSIFAGKLMQAGYDVTVLARGKRFEELNQNGLILQKANSVRKEITHPKIINVLAKDDIYDYIMVVMQKTQVTDVLPILQANGSKNIVFVVNNPLGYSDWIKAVGKERVMIGFPAAGGERKDGVAKYFIMDGIMRLFQTTTFGEVNGEKTDRLNKIIKAMTEAGIPSTWSPDMNAWQKTHVAFVTALGNLLYQYNSNNYEASKHYRDLLVCVKAIREGFAALKALGIRVTPDRMRIYSLPAPIVALVMKIVFKTKFCEFAMAKHTIAAKGEMQCLQKEFNTLIRKSGLNTPNIDRLNTYLFK